MSHELTIANLTVRYGRAAALTDVSFDAPGGSVTAVVGPNGAGKTSAMLAVYGSVPSTGRVIVDGEDVSGRRATDRAKGGIAIVPQGRQLFPRMTVRENLQMMCDVFGLPGDRVETALDRFPILRERSRGLAGVLSGGEQQMLVVTRALMGSPRVLLLDEMMTGLAPLIVQELADTVVTLARQEGVVVVMAEPSIGSLEPMIDRGVVMIRGEVVDRTDGGGAALDQKYRAAMGAVHESTS